MLNDNTTPSGNTTVTLYVQWAINQYYFDVNPDGIHYNENTGKIDEIIFTAVHTNMFDTNGDGSWSENL